MTTPAVTNEIVSVLGYYASGDGGGGNFYWDASSTEPANGGTIISNGAATGRWKRLPDTYISPLWFGARGNGTSDDTTYLQNALNAAQGDTLDGENRTYVVSTTIAVHSDTAIRNFKFKHAGSSADFTAVITVDGKNVAKRNISFENVYINGNRDNHTVIDPNNAGEDGGRHGIRCIGSCKHLTFRNLEVEYCAGDGLEFFSGEQGLQATDTYTFEYIKIEDARFSWNRRHGISGDCMRFIELKNVELSYNGIDTPAAAGKPANHGSRGDRTQDGALYGNGVDWEAYYNGNNMTDLLMDNVRAFKNAITGIQFWDYSKTSDTQTDWRPWERINIVNCYSDYGQFNTAVFGTGTPYNSAIRLLGAPLKGTFRDVNIENNFFKGNIMLQSCDKATISNNNADFSYPVGKDERPNQLLNCRDIVIRDLHYTSNVEPMLFYGSLSTGISYENSRSNTETAGKYIEVIPAFVQDLRVYRTGNTLRFFLQLSNTSLVDNQQILKFRWWATNNQPFKIINFYRVDNFDLAFAAVLKGFKQPGTIETTLTANAPYDLTGQAVFCEFDTVVYGDAF
jgi:hypothetical protein